MIALGTARARYRQVCSSGLESEGVGVNAVCDFRAVLVFQVIDPEIPHRERGYGDLLSRDEAAAGSPSPP
jgi:hypothetical protein